MNADPNLRSHLSAKLRAAIISGELAPAARINESQLSIEYGVSRTPLREALFTVERHGFVEADPRKGFFVTPLSAREVRELYPLGRALDLLAVRSAGEMPSPVVERLAAINKEFRMAANRPAKARIADRRFHHTIVERCPNRRLLTMLADVQDGMERYERLYMSDSADIKRSAAKHDGIIDSFRRDDLARAERILGETWDYSARRLLVALGEQL